MKNLRRPTHGKRPGAFSLRASVSFLPDGLAAAYCGVMLTANLPPSAPAASTV